MFFNPGRGDKKYVRVRNACIWNTLARNYALSIASIIIYHKHWCEKIWEWNKRKQYIKSTYIMYKIILSVKNNHKYELLWGI